MSAAEGFFVQYSVVAVFGSVLGCVMLPLITQVSRQRYPNDHLPPKTFLFLPISVVRDPHLFYGSDRADGSAILPKGQV